MDIGDVEREVRRAFHRTGFGMRRWDDPHPPPERNVDDEEYSRLTDPAKWRILNARVEAWTDAVVALGLAQLVGEPTIDWVEVPATTVTGVDLVEPVVAGGLGLVWCRSRMGDVDDAGVTLGVVRADGRAVVIDWFPDCGCDACDSGSQDALDVIDEHVRAVVGGAFRLLERRDRRIMLTAPQRWSARNIGSPSRLPGRRRPTRDIVADVLADPVGWDEWSGPSWMQVDEDRSVGSAHQ